MEDINGGPATVLGSPVKVFPWDPNPSSRVLLMPCKTASLLFVAVLLTAGLLKLLERESVLRGLRPSLLGLGVVRLNEGSVDFLAVQHATVRRRCFKDGGGCSISSSTASVASRVDSSVAVLAAGIVGNK